MISMLKDLLYKTSLLKLLLIDRILRKPAEKKISSDEIAREFGVNLNTVKKVFKELKELGYIEAKKRAGSRINPDISEEKRALYGRLSIKFQDIMEMGLEEGFSPIEIFSCFTGAFSSCVSSHGRGKIIFVEKNYYDLWTGKAELERLLGVRVVPMLLEDALRFFKGGEKENLIVTTYYCQPLLEREGVTNVVPLKVTPPLEELVDFSSIPKTSHILVVAVSNNTKERLKNQQGHLQKEFKNLRIVTIQEILKDTSLLEGVDILIILKLLYEEYRHIFLRIKKIFLYSRFYDREGIEFIKKYLLKEKFDL